MLPLRIKAEGFPGASLRDDILPAMGKLARTTECSVEVQANGVKMVAYPEDSDGELKAAFDRLYPASSYISTGTTTPHPHPVPATGRFEVRERKPGRAYPWGIWDTKWSRWIASAHLTKGDAQGAADAMNKRGD